MTDSNALADWINSRGFKMKSIAQAMDVSEYTLRQKVNGLVDFKVSQITAFCRFTGMTTAERDRIFFGDEVE